MNHCYASATSFRTALEERLRQRSQQTGVALDRLHKEVAYQWFLAQLDIAAPVVLQYLARRVVTAMTSASVRYHADGTNEDGEFISAMMGACGNVAKKAA